MKVFFLLLCLLYIQTSSSKIFLVFGGKTGWIGQKIVTLIQEMGHTPICAQSRLENRHDIINEIEKEQPDFIINAAGITGRPNVDWCEEHKQETIRTNVIGTLNIIDITFIYNIHLTNISTGCIYAYDEQHPIFSGIGFREEETPNFTGSFYSRTKIQMEKILIEYPHVLNLRIKMPVSKELNKGFIGKILTYQKVVNIPNSLSVLEELLPIAIDMTLQEKKGVYNFVNPGTISHNEILDLYKLYLNPSFTYENFSIEEHDKILKAKRANAELSAQKLLKEYPDILDIKKAIKKLFKNEKELQAL